MCRWEVYIIDGEMLCPSFSWVRRTVKAVSLLGVFTCPQSQNTLRILIPETGTVYGICFRPRVKSWEGPTQLEEVNLEVHKLGNTDRHIKVSTPIRKMT
jgi:hypothetical protein